MVGESCGKGVGMNKSQITTQEVGQYEGELTGKQRKRLGAAVAKELRAMRSRYTRDELAAIDRDTAAWAAQLTGAEVTEGKPDREGPA